MNAEQTTLEASQLIKALRKGKAAKHEALTRSAIIEIVGGLRQLLAEGLLVEVGTGLEALVFCLDQDVAVEQLEDDGHTIH